MAKRLIWSENAKSIRKEILEYWIDRNKSSKYSKKLNIAFNKSANQIAEFPFSGVQVAESLYRGKLIKDYYLLYKITENDIRILFIWDTRRNPSELLALITSFQK